LFLQPCVNSQDTLCSLRHAEEVGNGPYSFVFLCSVIVDLKYTVLHRIVLLATVNVELNRT